MSERTMDALLDCREELTRTRAERDAAVRERDEARKLGMSIADERESIARDPGREQGKGE